MQWKTVDLDTDKEFFWAAVYAICPSCERAIIRLLADPRTSELKSSWTVHPKTTARSPLPDSVPERFATDYREAASVLHASAKASAALSRRCLQALLRQQAGVKPGTLDSEINQVLESKQLPSWLGDDLDAVRTVGNFAAHSIKSTNTGEVVEVEPGEADWLLDVVEGLFDFYFVEPAKAQARRDAWNTKLGDAGKPPLKTS